jgi:excisionase family DNA binding protein
VVTKCQTTTRDVSDPYARLLLLLTKRAAIEVGDGMGMEARHGRLMTLAAAATYADVHPVTPRRWIAAGRLPAYRVGPRLIKVDEDELEAIIRPIRVSVMPRR